MSGKRKTEKLLEIKTLPNVFENPEGIKGKWKEWFFENSNPITLELGCGRGEYTIALARQFSERNFIGVDVKGPRIWKGAKIALNENLKNVAFLRILIENIGDYFIPGEVSEVWITFPDPWPKKPNKRLISPRFFNYYRSFLEKGTLINFKTDNRELYAYSLDVLKEEKIRPIKATNNLYESEWLDSYTGIPTYYEELFKKEGHSIHYLQFKL